MSDISYKRRMGDRVDGRLLRSLSPYKRLSPFVSSDKGDGLSYFSDSVEMTDIDRWLGSMRQRGYKGMGMLHVFLAAYVRTVAYKPGLNRFVSGQRVYSRHSIEVSMTVKRSLTDKTADATVKLFFSPADTIIDVYRRINEKTDEVMASETGTDADSFAHTMTRLPRPIANLTIGAMKALDYWGVLPSSVLSSSPFHGSLMISDPGSFGIQPIYRSMSSFGNLPVSLSFGAKRRTIELDSTGRPKERKYLDFNLVIDERPFELLYLADCIKHLKYLIKNPDLLVSPPGSVEQDVF